MKPNGVNLGLSHAERLDCETDVSSSKKWQGCVALPCVPGAGASRLSLPEKTFHLLELENIGGAGAAEKNICEKA